MVNTFLSGSVTIGHASVTTTSAAIISANAKRHALYIYNNSSGSVFLALGNNVVAGDGIFLHPATEHSFKIDSTNLYTGAISAITRAGSGSVSYIEQLTEE